MNCPICTVGCRETVDHNSSVINARCRCTENPQPAFVADLDRYTRKLERFYIHLPILHLQYISVTQEWIIYTAPFKAISKGKDKLSPEQALILLKRHEKLMVFL